MNIIKETLHIKIWIGYFVVLTVIGSMGFTLINERLKMQEVDIDLKKIQNLRNDISTVHQYITGLAFEGETVTGWEDVDFERYRAIRIQVDSLLQKLHNNCMESVQSERIDTLRQLLVDKEEHLLHIMQIFQKQKIVDSLLIFQLPMVAKQATSIREVTKKKKGFAGLFGKKEKITILPKKDLLHALNNKLITMQKKQEYILAVETDSLANRNMELNIQFIKFVTSFNHQIQNAFLIKEQKISEIQKNSFLLIAYMLVFAMLLLLVFYFIIHRDIRQKMKGHKKMEKIAEENKMLLEMQKKIILTVSHDIRGPLGNINNCAELAIDTREKKKRNVYLENVRKSCHHILYLVNNLLDIYRMNEKKDSKNDIFFKLNTLTEHIITRYSQVINNKGLLFTTELSGLEVTVKADICRIEQILDNLLTNAIKFTEVGEIRFIANYKNEKLTMEVQDTGIGMNKETLSRIFDPFEQAAQKINSEGFGLGLSIVKGLVELLDGQISVESSIGKGSVFRVILPVCKTDEVVEETNDSNVSEIHLPQHILVIDDDPVQLKVIKEMLERNKVFCETSSNIKETVQALRKQNFDIILTDIQMPGTDGFSILKLLRNSNIGNSRTVPIIVMTARKDKDVQYFIEAGFFDCIYKPFSIKELLFSISAVIQQKKKEEDTLDFKSLTTEISDKQNILELFIKETEREITELQVALAKENTKQLYETVHRMLPIWELLQTNDVLLAYHNMLSNKCTDKELLRKETEAIIVHAHKLISNAKNKIIYLQHETENINN